MNQENTHPIQAFAFDSHAVRVVMVENEHWFVAKDVCNCLDISNHRDALIKLDEDEKGDVGLTDAIGRLQDTAIINESGLYTLILRCRGATTQGTPAHAFRKWVTSEVLPSIRKTGSYAPPNSMEARLDRLISLLEEQQAIIKLYSQPKPKRVHRPVMPEEIIRARELFAQGFSQNEIARQLNRSSSLVHHWVKEAA